MESVEVATVLVRSSEASLINCPVEVISSFLSLWVSLVGINEVH